MFLEEPVELKDREVMADVTRQVNMPVATGEWLYNNETVEDVVRKQACDIVQPDVTNYGSLQEVQHAAAIAKSRHLHNAMKYLIGYISLALVMTWESELPFIPR